MYVINPEISAQTPAAVPTDTTTGTTAHKIPNPGNGIDADNSAPQTNHHA